MVILFPRLNSNLTTKYVSLSLGSSFTATTAEILKTASICTIRTHELKANAELVAGTAYMLATIPSGYEPAQEFQKEICLRNGVTANFYIGTGGTIAITPRSNISSGQAISLYETYMLT